MKAATALTTRRETFMSGDERFERVAGNYPGWNVIAHSDPPKRASDKVFNRTSLEHPAFAKRVRQALRMLQSGKSRLEVQTIHGGIVLKDALEWYQTGKSPLEGDKKDRAYSNYTNPDDDELDDDLDEAEAIVVEDDARADRDEPDPADDELPW